MYNAAALYNSQIELNLPLSNRDVLVYDEDIDLLLPTSLDSLNQEAGFEGSTGSVGVTGPVGYIGYTGAIGAGITGPTGPTRSATTLPDGSISTPAVAFENEPTLGFYRDGNSIKFGNTLSVASDITTMSRIDSNEVDVNGARAYTISVSSEGMVTFSNVLFRSTAQIMMQNSVYMNGIVGMGMNAISSFNMNFGPTTTSGILFSALGVELRSDFYPSVDNMYSLGTATRRWSSIWAANGTIQPSDASLKTNVQQKTLGLNVLNAIEPVKWRWVDDTTGQFKYGVTSNNMKSVLESNNESNLDVVDDGEDIEGVRYDTIIPMIISSLQELSAKITAERERRNV